ncbi:methyltransferase domain-containing protein [Desulfopila inferna]|uniref:methyltransferase domain-containing protein n=1 Tax=Desulfopila inferna TaxID=468528 RepID=UPI00196481DD|nr:methyltransferase domain-containing protein [Desulfopila inferna]MBM9602725.1 methyltransferase domain-containing protein [Desulfopila inferna]
MSTSLSITDKILYGLNIAESNGIEIGPLTSPLVKKSEGNVQYIDRASTKEIKEWYRKNETVDLEKIVEVDHIWGSHTLAEATRQKDHFDYCVAAHVIEHVPDLIGWLKEIAEVLCDNGIASFSIPDRRYTFDYLRPETIIADLLDAYYRKLKKPSIRHIYDHFSLFAEIDIVEAWKEGFDGSKLVPAKDPHKVKGICEDAFNNEKYIDSHCWVFTADSFIRLLDVLNRIGLLDFRIRRFFTVDYHNFEFVVQLEKLPASLDHKTKRMLFLESLKKTQNHLLRVEFTAYPGGEAQVYYDNGNGFNELDSCTRAFKFNGRRQYLEFSIPPIKLQGLRFDPVKKPAVFKIDKMELVLFGETTHQLSLADLQYSDHLKITRSHNGSFWGITHRKANDPFVILQIPQEVRNDS